ncbi:hypothetical protein CTI12_AA308650 [Artemisia annua]|uniref:RRM domain-containing protein n=1 Tax=Artemisia annua TaxID=35608 RepID=A0A2U1N0Q1_ARTAN|nr:hypothetical protein CTI12_AA308650 [Artemisia annua]
MENIVSTVKNIDPAKVWDTVSKGSAETVKNIDPAKVCDTVAKGSAVVSAGAKGNVAVGAQKCDDRHMRTRKRHVKSNEDYTQKISHSIYVTNFPDSVSSRDLWRECNAYGTVVDVFIPSKKSMAGKRFAFVRFIKVFNLERLINNLCTIWIGRHHLFANQVRYERPHKPFSSSLNDKSTRPVKVPPSIPRQPNGVKDVNSIPNLLTLLFDEGFTNIKLKYLGDFASEERIVWVDLEGVPLHAWSYQTFSRIGREWGELLNIEDSSMPSFGRKRVCIFTKSPLSILASFKIIVRGKIFMVRAKELFTWNPHFLVVKEDLSSSDDDSVQGEKYYAKQPSLSEEEEGEFNTSEVEGVAETIFEDFSSSPKQNSGNSNQKHSEDPFDLYNLLSKKKNVGEDCVPSPSLSHPPGFTPVGFESKFNNAQDNGEINGVPDKVLSLLADDKIMNPPQVVHEEPFSSSSGHNCNFNVLQS